jgi:hypothetical protein
VQREAIEQYGRWFVRAVTDEAWFDWSRDGQRIKDALAAGEITELDARTQEAVISPEFDEIPIERVYVYVADI